jgi:type IV pilus assembly protein PilA
MKKNKGFTLIELLAVIIVLAIIMVLTIPNVLSTMNNSKNKALVVFGKKAIVQAQKYIAEQELTGTPKGAGTYDFDTIGLTDTGNYKGAVKYDGTTDGYSVQVTDGSKYICGKTLSTIENADAVGAKTSACDWSGFNSASS